MIRRYLLPYRRQAVVASGPGANLRGWIYRHAAPAPITGASGNLRGWIFRYMRQAQGKVCTSISMTIPGATFAMGIPGVEMSMGIPGIEMTMTTTGVDVSVTIPGVTIDMECCDD